MIGIPQSVRILIGTTPIDMRKSIDGLTAIVQQEMKEDAYSGHLFIFVSRRRDRVKILAWDKGRLRARLQATGARPVQAAAHGPVHDGRRDRTPRSSRCCSTGSTSAASGAPITGSPHPRLDLPGRRPMDKPRRAVIYRRQ
ncbi:MAG: IS66 family insertion sequence element accessory protein TnpB [Anaeromyxobacter sp.]